MGMDIKEGDFLKLSFVASTHDHVLLFTNRGKVYKLKCYQIPEGGRRSRGKAMINILPKLDREECVITAVPVKSFDEDGYLVFVSRKGFIKRCKMELFRNIRSSGIIAIDLDENDELVDVIKTSGDGEIFVASKNGQACWFGEDEIRPMGRSARGVIGIRLDEGDEVVSLDYITEKRDILTVTENGFGKRTPLEDYRKTHRGSKGVRTIITNERNGKVVFAKSVKDDDEILVVSRAGMMTRLRVRDIRRQGRNTMGVRIVRLRKDDKVICVSRFET